MNNKMSDRLKGEILRVVESIAHKCAIVKHHIEKDRHKTVIMDALKWVKKDTDISLKWIKEEYRKECYGIRKEQQ